MTTKLHAIPPPHGLQANHCRAMDTSGCPIRLFITAGQVSDYTSAAALMNDLPGAEWLCEALIDKSTKPRISGRKSRKKTAKYPFRDIALQCTAGQWKRDATSDATVSRDCLGGSRTGGGSQHAMIDHQPSYSRQSHSLQPSYSGYEP